MFNGKLFFITFLTILLSIEILNAQEADSILGDWFLPEEKSEGVIGEPIAEIFKHGGKYYAYGFALKDRNGNITSDMEGISDEEKEKILERSVFLAHLKYDNGKWVDGILYSTKNKRYFFVTITISEDKNTLFVEVAQKKGSRYSRTLEWTRATENYKEYKPKFVEIVKKIPAEPEN